MSVGEAASRVGVAVYHPGQGQDERARPRPAPLLRGLDSAWSGGSNPHPHRERGGGLRQTLEQARARGHVRQRGDAGTAGATPLAQGLSALAKDFAARRTQGGA